MSTTITIAEEIATMTGADPEKIAARIDALVEIVDEHRIDSPELSGQWLVWDLRVSERTMEKFVRRAKSAGYRSAFTRRERFGVHVDHLVKGA